MELRSIGYSRDIRKPTFMIKIFTLRYGFLNDGKGNIVDEVESIMLTKNEKKIDFKLHTRVAFL